VKDDTDDMAGMWAQRDRQPKMFVIKRDGKQERVSFDKVTSRIEKLAYGLNQQFVDPCLISQKVVKGLYAGVKTADLDTLAAETAVKPSSVNQKCQIRTLVSLRAHVGFRQQVSLLGSSCTWCPNTNSDGARFWQAYLTTEHPDYSILAARIAVSNMHKMTEKSFSTVMKACYDCVDTSSGQFPRKIYNYCFVYICWSQLWYGEVAKDRGHACN